MRLISKKLFPKHRFYRHVLFINDELQRDPSVNDGADAVRSKIPCKGR